MKFNILLCVGVLLYASSAFGAVEKEFNIECLGRPPMTVVRANYGLSMLMWSQSNFVIASGQNISHLPNGDKVSITQFRDGDQLFDDKSNGDIFFEYLHSENLQYCHRLSSVGINPLIPTPFKPGISPKNLSLMK